MPMVGKYHACRAVALYILVAPAYATELCTDHSAVAVMEKRIKNLHGGVVVERLITTPEKVGEICGINRRMCAFEIEPGKWSITATKRAAATHTSVAIFDPNDNGKR